MILRALLVLIFLAALVAFVSAFSPLRRLSQDDRLSQDWVAREKRRQRDGGP